MYFNYILFVSQKVIHALSDDEGLYYDEVSQYHKYTPSEILEDLLNQILDNDNLDAGTRFSCLQVFLRSNVKKLQTGIFPHSYYDRIMETISLNGRGLLYLNLKGVWMKDNPKLLNEVLTNLALLKVLHIPHMADDFILQTISNYTNLKILDISGECNFTDKGLLVFAEQLKNNKSLIKILDIGSFGEENIPHEIIAELIQSLPNLHSLCSYSYVGKSLLSIYKTNPNFTCKLKHLHDTYTTQEICKAISKTCPTLENLYFDSPDLEVIKLLNPIPTLTKLKLTNYQCTELHSLLENWGQSLRTLKLSLGKGIFDLSILANCSNLNALELYKMEFVTHTTERVLVNLQHFEVCYSEMTSSCLKYVLGQSPLLQKVTVGQPVKITDGDLYRLCADLCLLGMYRILTIFCCPSLKMVNKCPHGKRVQN